LCTMLWFCSSCTSPGWSHMLMEMSGLWQGVEGKQLNQTCIQTADELAYRRQLGRLVHCSQVKSSKAPSSLY
jgi:hypothetical protein